MKLLSRKYAIKLSLEVWGWIKDHPEVYCKSELPLDMYDKFSFYRNECPLCEKYWKYYSRSGVNCSKKCPLKIEEKDKKDLINDLRSKDLGSKVINDIKDCYCHPFFLLWSAGYNYMTLEKINWASKIYDLIKSCEGK